MANIGLTTIGDFQNNFETQNGQIADAAVLNKAVHRAQQEIIGLWNWVRNGIGTIDDSKTLFFDTIDGSTPTDQCRSIAGLHSEVFNGGTWS